MEFKMEFRIQFQEGRNERKSSAFIFLNLMLAVIISTSSDGYNNTYLQQRRTIFVGFTKRENFIANYKYRF